jgi:hypothetical protein
MRSVLLGMTFGVLGFLTACGGGGQTQTAPPPPVLQSIQVTGPSANLTAGQSQQMKAMGNYSNNSTQDLTGTATWSTSDATVASVAASGMLSTTNKGGSCTVTAKVGSVTGSFSLTVVPALVSISVTPATASIAVQTAQQFIAAGTYSDGSTQNITGSVTWTSSNTASATVSSSVPTSGLAKAVAGGNTTITATSGSISGTASLTVTSATVTSIVVAPANTSLPLGLTQQYTATATFSDGTSQDVTGVATWQSSSTSVASITVSGLATARNVGSTNISAAFGSVSGSTSLAVNAANLNSISIQPANGSIAQGSRIQMAAIGTFNDGGTRNITSLVNWTSSDPTVAKMGGTNGLFLGLAPGLVTITASLGSVTSAVPFTVTNATIVSISVTPSTTTIPIGGHTTFHAIGVFSDSSTQDISTNAIWSSSTPAIATVGSSSGSYGLAVGIASGQVTVSASFSSSGASATGTAALTVSTAILSSITLTPATAVLAPASGLQYSAVGTFTDGTTQYMSPYVTWSSSNTSVAGISVAGVATGQSAGTTTITAQSGSVSAMVGLVVESAALTSIRVTPLNSAIPATVQVQFTATGTFANGDTQNLTAAAIWTSSSLSVATVSNAQGSFGLATGVQAGSATISAVFAGQVGTASLTVTNATLVSVVVNPASASISTGASQQFAATGTFSDGSTAGITTTSVWTSSNNSVATIDSRGVASGIASGTSTITAAMNGVNSTAVLTVQ